MIVSSLALRRALIAALTATLVIACGEGGGKDEEAPTAAELQAPSQAPDLAARNFEPVGEASGVTGPIALTETYRMGDAATAGESGAVPGQTILTLRGAAGRVVEAQLLDVVDAGAQVGGQSLRSLMALPLDARPTLYRVTSETNPEGGAPLCGQRPASHIVSWEPAMAGEPVLKLLVVAGEAPGVPGTVLCHVLEYRPAAG